MSLIRTLAGIAAPGGPPPVGVGPLVLGVVFGDTDAERVEQEDFHFPRGTFDLLEVQRNTLGGTPVWCMSDAYNNNGILSSGPEDIRLRGFRFSNYGQEQVFSWELAAGQYWLDIAYGTVEYVGTVGNGQTFYDGTGMTPIAGGARGTRTPITGLVDRSFNTMDPGEFTDLQYDNTVFTAADWFARDISQRGVLIDITNDGGGRVDRQIGLSFKWQNASGSGSARPCYARLFATA